MWLYPSTYFTATPKTAITPTTSIKLRCSPNASTEEGNVLTEEQQWAKMREVVEVADEIWGR